MKLFGTKIEICEYEAYDDIITDTYTSKYFLGIRISKTCVTTKTPIPPITSIERKTATMGTITLTEGMRVIVRSNEPAPLMVCNISTFTTLGGKVGSGVFPVIVDEADGEAYLAMGIVLPHTDELMEELKDLKPIEQWNYLSSKMGQIKEKYGVKYKTFR